MRHSEEHCKLNLYLRIQRIKTLTEKLPGRMENNLVELWIRQFSRLSRRTLRIARVYTIKGLILLKYWVHRPVGFA